MIFGMIYLICHNVTLLRLSNFMSTRCLWEKMRHQELTSLVTVRAITTSSQALSPRSSKKNSGQPAPSSVRGLRRCELSLVQSLRGKTEPTFALLTGRRCSWCWWCDSCVVPGLVVLLCETRTDKPLAKQYKATSSHQAGPGQHPSDVKNSFIKDSVGPNWVVNTVNGK